MDDLFPFFQETREPLFLSLDDQIWPMVLQKALSQLYNGYFEPGKIPLHELLYTITGNQCFRKPIPRPTLEDEKVEYKAFILSVLSNNCIHLLQPRAECPIKSE